jgi:hypothetical protein
MYARSGIVDARRGSFAGVGLITLVDVPKGMFLTHYGGERISHIYAMQLLAEGASSHVRSVHSMQEHIRGYDTLPAIECKGLASFANDAMGPQKIATGNNVKFHKLWDRRTASTMIVLKSLRDISAGEDVLVSYGEGYWSRLSL